jgi:hypothetical protein
MSLSYPDPVCQDRKTTSSWLVAVRTSFLFRQEVEFKLCPDEYQSSDAQVVYTMDYIKTAHL